MNNSITNPNEATAEGRLAKVSLIKRSETHGHHIWKTMDNVSLKDVVHRAGGPGIEAIVFEFDPFNPDSKADLEFLCTNALPTGVLFVTYSLFNPDWIENLVFAAGADLHCRGLPDLATITVFIEQRI